MKVETTKIFTPSSLAINSFIERAPAITSQLVDSLRTPGKQIVVYGYSGCGKSTLVTNKLNQVYENAIVTRCMKGMTLENILADGFDQLNNFITDEEVQKKFSINPKISLEYADIKASFSIVDYTKQTTQSKSQILPPQLTASRLGKFFGESNCCWVLEDFHKIDEEEKPRVSQIMKVFMDMSQDYCDLKIIALGAVGTAREVVEYDHEMNNRISEILVPPMNTDEIKEIITTGEKALNIQFKVEQKNKIAEYSCGIPAICHQLCLNMCFIKKIYKTLDKRRTFNDEDLEEAIEKFISERSDSLKADYDLIMKESNGISKEAIINVLKASIRVKKNEFSKIEIKDKLEVRIEDGEIDLILKELSSVERTEVLIFSEASGNFRFNNLFIKNYIYMNLTRNEETPDLVLLKEKGSIDKLLDIIHKDLSEKYGDILFE